MFLRFDEELASDKFISIVILSYNRPDMTKNLIESIHQHADMPFELIVHDDASGGQVPQDLLTMKSKISTLILGHTVNMGLAAAFNRGTALANSDYVLTLNDDALMVGPGLQDIVKVLNIPYVGAFGPWQVSAPPGDRIGGRLVRVNPQGLSFFLSPSVGSGSIMAFRKEAWQKIGGCPQVGCGASDTGLMRNFLKHGYFNATRFARESEIFDNVDFPECPRSTIGTNKFDAAYPQIFKAENFEGCCRSRWHRIEGFMKTSQAAVAGLCNDNWWHDYFVDNCIPEENNFNWDNMTYHQQWRGRIEEDRVKP